MATLITPIADENGDYCTVVSPRTKPSFSLEELQTFVGGYVQRIQLDDKRAMYVNEDGKYHSLPFNQVATNICHKNNSIYPWDCIVGRAIIVNSYEEN